MNIFYLGYFANLNEEHRSCSPAANNVGEYVKNVLLDLNLDNLKIINIAQPINGHETLKLNKKIINNVEFINPPCKNSGKFYNVFIKPLVFYRWYKKYLLKNSSEGDVIIIYHTCHFNKLTKALKKANRKIILQVEEVYTDVFEGYCRKAKSEFASINRCDALIFASDVFKNDIRISQKPSAILYGSYEPILEKKNRNEENIKLVYAGTIDPIKHSAINAINAMKYLPNNFKLDLFVHGNNIDYANLEKIINNKNISLNHAIGEKQLLNVLTNYDIGLAVQDSKEAFNNTSFPSKVLTYLKTGLAVVSTNSKSIIESSIKGLVIFTKSDDAKDIADAILSVKNSNSNSEVLHRLSQDFKNNLHNLIKEVC